MQRWWPHCRAVAVLSVRTRRRLGVGGELIQYGIHESINTHSIIDADCACGFLGNTDFMLVSVCIDAKQMRDDKREDGGKSQSVRAAQPFDD